MKAKVKKRDFLTMNDFSSAEILKILKRALVLKKARGKKTNTPLRGKSVGIIFEKPSTRTRVSFEVGVKELGGETVILESGSSQLGRGETYHDTAHVLSRYLHGIVIRTFSQEGLEELAQSSSVPVVNALSDYCHPCQIMADLLTILEVKKSLKGPVAYVGDGNNMANTWIMAAMILGFPLRIATPKGFECDATLVKEAKASKNTKNFIFTHDPKEAVTGAHVVNTDTWFSMGQEVSDEKRKLFEPYQVNASLMKLAAPKAMVLHCLPAHRGEEITDEVMDGAQSYVWQEAENRLHVQKAILEFLIK